MANLNELLGKLISKLNEKLPASALAGAVNDALAQAKASGEFDGKDGNTPVKGLDYWTPDDQEAIVQQVITALGTPVFGTVDAENNIILTGNLADGTYTIKYEDAEGNVTEIGTLNHSNVAEPTYTNLFVPETATINTRMSGSSQQPTNKDGYVMSGLIQLPEPITITTSYDDTTPFIVVPATMWVNSANLLGYKADGTQFGYVGYSNTAGTVIDDWVKIPLFNEWNSTGSIAGFIISLYVSGTSITNEDIQNIKIYYNEIPE